MTELIVLDPSPVTANQNLILNPSFEYDTASAAPSLWTSIVASPTTFLVQTGWAASGTKSCRLTQTSTTSQFLGWTLGPATATAISISGGSTYALTVALNLLANGLLGTVQARIRWYTAALGFITDAVYATAAAGTTGALTLTPTGVAPANARYAIIQVGAQATATSQTLDGYLDSAMFVQGAVAPTYADGDSTGWQWNGTPGNSISVFTGGIAANRIPLDITSWVAAAGPDWGDAEIQAYMADQAVGSSPVDYRIPNRQIKIPLILRDQATPFATIRQQVQSKVGLFQREGGWIMRQTGSAYLQNVIADPSFEQDAIGSDPPVWAPFTSSPAPTTFAVQAGWASSGVQSLRLTQTSTAGSQFLAWFTGNTTAPAAAGSQWSASVTVNILTNTVGGAFTLRIRWYNAGGVFIADSALTSITAGSTGIFTMTVTGATAPANTAYASLVVGANSSATSQTLDGYLDATLLVQSATVPAYFDGDTPGYMWTGTPGNSISQTANRLYADVVNATLHLGGAWLQAYRNADIDAVLSLECVPDWYGDEIQLSDHVETVLPHLTFTEPLVNGNHPGRVRLVVDNDQAVDQLGLLWGFQARNYNSGTTAALFYEAEALTPLNGGSVGALAGASGGSAVYHSTLPANAWVPILQTAMVGGTTALTHAGSYRAWARCYGAGTFLPQLQLQWGVGGLSVPQTNDAIQIPGVAAFYMLDLGEVRIDPPPVGTGQWTGVIQANTTVANDPVAIDSIYFQPLDESAGKLQYVSVPTGISTGQTSAGTATDGTAVGTQAWTSLTNVYAKDNLYAECGATGGTSHWLMSGAHGFAIPTGTTIKGIVVTITKRNPASPTGCSDSAVRLIKAGTVQAGDRAKIGNWPLAFQDFTYGTPSDLWGGSWTPADINNSGFGAAISVVFTNSRTPRVDWIAITVYYTYPSGLTVAQDAVIYASKTAELRTDGMFRQVSGGTIYGPISSVIGDLPRIPPSGLENRTIRCSIWSSRGDFNQLPDSGVDDLSARITYRPSYLITP